MNIRFIYITAAHLDEGKAIGRALVSSRLAACVNIIHPVHSLYWWKGDMQESSEVVVVAKTRDDLVNDLIEKVKSVHSYECPCIVALPIREGNKDFLDWVVRETGTPKGQ
jgi:periplasmic divalent cation tolerance protein